MNRLLALISRIGTALVAIGLALLLISLIPHGSSGTNSQQSNISIQPSTYYQVFTQDFVTPQESVTLTVTSDNSIDVYLLEVSSSTLYDWIASHYTTKYFYNNNVTYLKSFLGNFSQTIAYSQTSTLSFSHQYIPTKITNVTFIVSNPTPSMANVQTSAMISQQVAPASKVATLADWSIPIGLVLAIPWFIDLYNTKFGRSKPEPGTPA